MAPITINGITFDPAATSSFSVPVPPAADAATTNYILVQAAEPLTGEQRAQLIDLGVVVQEYVPEDTYLCAYPPTDLGPVRELPFVEWVDVYRTGFKIVPELRPEPTSTTSRSETAGTAPSTPALSRTPREVEVVMHPDVDPEDEAQRVADAARVGRENVQIARGKVRVTVEEGRLAELAGLDAVHHVEPVPVRQLFNDVARDILDAEVVINGEPYQGDGEIVAVADTGLDLGRADDVHAAFGDRVLKIYALGRTGPDRADDPNGHGTHVAGSVLGDDESAAVGGPIQGTAPRARLVFQSTLDDFGGLGGLPADLHDLFEPPYNDGARVHTNSWGATRPGLPYDMSAREIDDMVWTNPDLVICFAAGNSGTDVNDNGVVDAGSIGSQSAAKNCITSGASESLRPEFNETWGRYWPDDFPADPIHSDRQANDVDGMVAFSSRGPTRERRIKPDVVAPGSCILSARSRAVATPSSVFGVSPDDRYTFSSGTSMATPLVAGCAAVVRESLVRSGVTSPTAALVKALLINGATDLPGQYSPSEAGASPNHDSGFDRVNLARAVVTPGAQDTGFVEAQVGDDDEQVGQVEVPAGASLKVTLVWSDPPGAALQNVLDLIVRSGDGTERHGNMGTSAGFDRRNNVEQVLWTDLPASTIEVAVRAFRLTRSPQPYAWVWRVE